MGSCRNRPPSTARCTIGNDRLSDHTSRACTCKPGRSWDPKGPRRTYRSWCRPIPARRHSCRWCCCRCRERYTCTFDRSWCPNNRRRTCRSSCLPNPRHRCRIHYHRSRRCRCRGRTCIAGSWCPNNRRRTYRSWCRPSLSSRCTELYCQCPGCTCRGRTTGMTGNSSPNIRARTRYIRSPTSPCCRCTTHRPKGPRCRWRVHRKCTAGS